MSFLRSRKNGGYVLLLSLLVVVVLGMIFYYTAVRGPGVDLNTGEELANPPWQQWKKVEKYLRRNGLGELTSQQLEITESMGLGAEIYDGKDGKGVISLVFKTDYTVKCSWAGTFFVDADKEIEHQIAGSKIEGYLVPDETLLDIENEYGHEYTYFLAEGSFMAIEYNKSNVRRVSGFIYVSGWLAPDLTVEQGEVTITSDNKRFKQFTFSGKAGKIDMPNIEGLKEIWQNGR